MAAQSCTPLPNHIVLSVSRVNSSMCTASVSMYNSQSESNATSHDWLACAGPLDALLRLKESNAGDVEFNCSRTLSIICTKLIKIGASIRCLSIYIWKVEELGQYWLPLIVPPLYRRSTQLTSSSTMHREKGARKTWWPQGCIAVAHFGKRT